MSEEKPKPPMEIKIDTSLTNEIIRENERLKIEQEKEKDKKNAFELAKLDLAEETGDDSFREVTSSEELTKKLHTLLKIGVEQVNKLGDLAGSAPMNPQQYGTPQQSNDLRKLPVNANTIMYLNNLRRNGSTEASQILDALWAKSINSWRQAGHQPIEYSPDDDVQKSNTVPDLNFDNLKNGEQSGFPN